MLAEEDGGLFAEELVLVSQQSVVFQGCGQELVEGRVAGALGGWGTGLGVGVAGAESVRHGNIAERNESRRYSALHAGSHREPDPEEAAAIRDELEPPVVVEPRRTETGDLGGVKVYAFHRP